jgi:Beta-L-arabinofuranosidase, GH127 catalytic domain/Beta-L-arabinofuranosidase, GH127 middle domain
MSEARKETDRLESNDRPGEQARRRRPTATRNSIVNFTFRHRAALPVGWLAGLLAAGLLQFCPNGFAASAQAEVHTVQRPPTTRSNPFYIGNRAPLVPSPLLKLPIGAITPKGWLRHQLELEADGMTGHLEDLSKWCNFKQSAWASPEGQGKFGWEEVPYWLKGFGDLGYVLGDQRIINDARKWLDAVLSSQEPDGYFGPRANRTGLNGKPDLWPHIVMCNVLQSFYEYTRDARVLPFLTRYFQWLNSLPAADFGAGYWPKIRFGDNIQTIYWLYNRTGDKFLLELARKIHTNMARWDTGVINWHNVNIAEGFREPAVFYQEAHNPRLLQDAERNYDTVMGIYGQFPGGGFAGDENCRPGYTGPRQGIETCGIVEFMHSFEMLTKISGNPLWAERCEQIAFNTFPAALTPDLKALHYLTCANQVQLDTQNKSPEIQNGGCMFAYSPYGIYRCCQHNVSHGWPYYAEELWLATEDGGLCASLYSASAVSATVGNGAKVKLDEVTEYPFSQTVRFKLSCARAIAFPLYLRIPGWCSAPAIQINGEPVPIDAKPLSYVVLEQTWKPGDEIKLELPMHITVQTWTKNHDSVSVNYGPLTFSLDVGERWKQCGGTAEWPEYEVFPSTPWNYGLVLDQEDPAASFKVVKKTGPLAMQPFTPDTAPIVLLAKARRIPAWKLDRFGMVGKLQPSPAESDQPLQTVTLIPMGAARLRISAFPVIGHGPHAHEWVAPKVPPVSASHCGPNDSVEAMIDGKEPKNSSDHNIPRFTWWDHRGTREWVQYDFGKLRQVSEVEVYWFDDTGHGQCRVPQSWKLLYQVGERWEPVQATSPYGARLNAYNRLTFDPIRTTGLRIEAQLRPGFSAGILEWKVGQ